MVKETNTLGGVNSVDFAIYITEKAKDKGIPINITQLQKLLYICYGTHLAANKGVKLLDERPEAWYYGPFFPNVHKEQKRHKNGLEGLTSRISLDDFVEYDYIVDPALDHFGRWTASELVNWTHEKGKAWDKRYNMEGKKHFPLDDNDIRLDFEKFIS